MADGYKIDKGVPIPKTDGKGNRKYPFRFMEVGDSVFIDDKSRRNSVAGTLSHYSLRYDMEFTTRVEGDGFRVWRVK